ncbi:MAG: hypothetical protein HY921_12770 [Elusimicrobia bacterium]|nr:hypothetical protein [Elusimicrobiota bacterium]
MLVLVFYYLVLPFLLGWVFIKIIKKYGRPKIPAEVALLYAERPIEKGYFRVVKRRASGVDFLGDFEKQPEAVDEMYRARASARAQGEPAAFFVLNDQGEALEEVDS